MITDKNVLRAFQYYHAGDLSSAEKICRNIIKKHPHNIDILYFLGIICYQRGDCTSAVRYFRQVVEHIPGRYDVHYNLGRALEKQGKRDDAIQEYQTVLALNPHFPDADINLGKLFHGTGQLQEAIKHYSKAIEQDPNLAGAYYNLGVALHESGRLDEAILSYQQAVQRMPGYADAYHDLGFALQEKGLLEDAVQSYRMALRINPDLFDAYNNLGRALQEIGKLDEAIDAYSKALEINPDLADAHVNLAFLLLLHGDFQRGWQEYEWRWKRRDYSPYRLGQPLWDGSALRGTTILLHAEQGLGDTIQFIRYAPLVAQRGARVIIQCHKELQSLLQSVEGVSQVVTPDEPTPPVDLHCPLLSLPLIFNTTPETVPAAIPYLQSTASLKRDWRERLKGDTKFRIGLVWSGNPKYKRDFARSCSLSVFAPLMRLDGISLYSLQKGEAAVQVKEPLDWLKLIDFTDDIQDFSDTAAFIENLDLIISVDTSVVHLAGSLGRPVWTMLPFIPDWRWMLSRDDSPWYPSMRLFRQAAPGNWGDVISKIDYALRQYKVSKDKH